MSLSYTSKSLLIVLSLICSSIAFANTFTTPEEAVNTYITGVKTGSGEHIKMAFSESASIQYYDDTGKYNKYSRNDFADLVNTGNLWNAKIEITQMKVTNKAANATVEFTWGETGNKGYVDYINLVHNGETWQITDKVANYIDR